MRVSSLDITIRNDWNLKVVEEKASCLDGWLLSGSGNVALACASSRYSYNKWDAVSFLSCYS